MTNLPATLDDEAEMFAFAREWIARFREGNFMDLGLAGHAFVRHLIKQIALMHPFNMDEIVKAANAGWDEADIALRELISEYAQRHEPPPAALAAYLISYSNPNYVRPTSRVGRRRPATL